MARVIHRVSCMLSKEVEIEDGLWKRFNEGEEAAQDEVNDFMSKHGVNLPMEDVEEVQDEWYDEIKEVV